MSLQNAELPPETLAILYPNCLVAPLKEAPGNPAADLSAVPDDRIGETSGQPSEYSAGSAAPYRFLGKNNRNVTIIARYPDDAYLPDTHLDFLTKILSACKMNLADVAIVNDSTVAVRIAPLKNELSPRALLSFNVPPAEIGLPLSFPAFKPQQYEGTVYLYLPPIQVFLAESEETKALKKQLWDCLQKMFLS